MEFPSCKICKKNLEILTQNSSCLIKLNFNNLVIILNNHLNKQTKHILPTKSRHARYAISTMCLSMLIFQLFQFLPTNNTIFIIFNPKGFIEQNKVVTFYQKWLIISSDLFRSFHVRCIFGKELLPILKLWFCNWIKICQLFIESKEIWIFHTCSDYDPNLNYCSFLYNWMQKVVAFQLTFGMH